LTVTITEKIEAAQGFDAKLNMEARQLLK